MADTKVSRLIRVKQGKTTIQFELLGDSLTIELPRRGQKHVHFTVQKEGVAVLRELLGGGRPVVLPPGDTRFDPPKVDEGKPTPEGLTRFPDGTEAGME